MKPGIEPYQTTHLRHSFGVTCLPTPIVDTIDDGMTDEEIAAHTQAWLAELREQPIIDIGTTAAEVLDELYADGEL